MHDVLVGSIFQPGILNKVLLKCMQWMLSWMFCWKYPSHYSSPCPFLFFFSFRISSTPSLLLFRRFQPLWGTPNSYLLYKTSKGFLNSILQIFLFVLLGVHTENKCWNIQDQKIQTLLWKVFQLCSCLFFLNITFFNLWIAVSGL